MPTLITRGALSGKGFGLTNQVSAAPVLQTVTFTSSGNWVAPATTTMVQTLTGKGQDGISDTNLQNMVGDYLAAADAGSSGSAIDWSTLYNLATSQASSIVGLYTTTTYQKIWLIGSGNTGYLWSDSTGTYTPPGGVPITSAYATGLFPPTPTSGQILYSDLQPPNPTLNGYRVYAVSYLAGGPGANSSALGKTFPGGTYSSGTGYPATAASYSNVSVVPGTSYGIIVGSGGYVTLQYYA